MALLPLRLQQKECRSLTPDCLQIRLLRRIERQPLREAKKKQRRSREEAKKKQRKNPVYGCGVAGKKSYGFI